MVESVTARVSVLPDVGSELPTVYVGNGAFDVVGLRVGSEWIRRKPCWLCSAGCCFFWSCDECGEDGSSPVVQVSGSLVCHVDLDSRWMVPWDDRRSHTGLSIWRSVMCSIARLSCMPVIPDTGCLKSFGTLGRECVLDLNTGETCTPVWSPECGLETIPSKPPFPPCRVMVCLLIWSRKCAVVRGCAGNGHSPGETQDAYAWLVTWSLLFGSPLRRVQGSQQPPLLCIQCPGRAGGVP